MFIQCISVYVFVYNSEFSYIFVQPLDTLENNNRKDKVIINS